jgi:hypothetical protein
LDLGIGDKLNRENKFVIVSCFILIMTVASMKRSERRRRRREESGGCSITRAAQ